MARLVIFDERVRAVELPAHPVILGRSQKADIPIHDEILSRKHCSIVPSASGLSIIDLKSQNGTFLNGSRIERSDLGFDDIIEIGNTVIVLLDSDTWKRGEGLARLRNPRKAQELIGAIKKRQVGRNGQAARQGAGGALRGKKELSEPEDAFVRRAQAELLQAPAGLELLEAYMANQLGALLVKHSSDIREVALNALDRVLAPGAVPLEAGGLRAALRKALGEALAREKDPPPPAGNPEAPGGGEEPAAPPA